MDPARWPRRQVSAATASIIPMTMTTVSGSIGGPINTSRDKSTPGGNWQKP